MAYIKIPKVYTKLKKAEELFAPVIMTAATGWGKSAAVEYFYRRKKYLTLYCKDGNLTQMPSPDTFRSNVVIIEDMQNLLEEESISYLKRLLHVPGLQIVMLTRGTVPKYLVAEEMDMGFVRITERDLALGEKEVAGYFNDRGVDIHPDDIPVVTNMSKGYFRAVYFYASRMDGGQRYSEDIQAAVWQDIFFLWDGQFFDKSMDEYIHFALCVCQYDEVSREMAEYLTGDRNIGTVIEYSMQNMSQIVVRSDGCYSLRPEVRAYYKWKQNLVWTKEEMTENFRRGANFYEMNGDISHALEYYRKAGATQRIKDLLIRNTTTHPGVGHYIETKEYYFALPKEEIINSPYMMAGMSMLCSLLLQPEQSEEWYRELEGFYKDKSNSRERRKDARVRLAYLDIALPHRGTKGLIRVMREAFILTQKGDIVLPEFSVTSNMPSVMNGGLDFSEWSKTDVQIAKFMGKPVEAITGKFGNGLVTLALAESGFEKGTMDPYEVLTRVGDGFEAAAHGGKIEMCFVSIGIQVRQHLVEGQLPSARRSYESFVEKAKLAEAAQLYPSLEAFGTWLSLYGGTEENIKSLIKSVPDAKVEFSILDRYRQMIKLRCLIAENMLDEALSLSTFLNSYFVSYNRTFYWMENMMLRAIILYRMEDEHWKQVLHEGLSKAAEYHFIRIPSMEGAAIFPCIKEMQDNGELSDIDKDFMDAVVNACIRMASNFPDYLHYIPKETVSFTKRESEVLSLLCSGMEMEKICEALNISYAGLKKHNRNIYKKLGVKNRAEAERKASRLGLVVRRSIN